VFIVEAGRQHPATGVSMVRPLAELELVRVFVETAKASKMAKSSIILPPRIWIVRDASEVPLDKVVRRRSAMMTTSSV
jgi:hypothetical protein